MSISTRMLGFAAFLGVIAAGMTAQSALAAPAVPKVGRYAASTYTPPMPPAFVRIIDNGDSGFSTSKGWVGPYRGQGYGNDVHFTTKGNGSRTAGWTFEDLPAGRYQVAATWSSFKNRATNAPFRILSTSDEGATVRVNQQQRPDDFSADGASWKHLGMLEVTGNGRSIRVILSNDANGFVIADAIRIERVQVSPVCGNGIVEEGEQCDDGNTTNFDGCSHRCDRQTALHCADLIPAQQAAVTHCRNAGFDGICFNAFGGGFQGCVSAARNDCTQNNANASINVLCATGIATSSSAPIVSSFSSSSSTTSRYSSRPYTGEVRIIDNDTEGFSILSGIWGKGVLGYNGGNRWNMAGTGQDRAMWKFHVTPGTYRVSTTWGEHPNRATNTPFRVTDGSRELLSVRVNQEKAPEGLHAHGAVWKYLGTVTVQGDTLTVEISDDADEYVIADAIRIERVLMGPVCGNGLVESYEECDDGNTSDGDACSASCTEGNRERAFRALDVNHDGSITLEEARQRINAAVAALRTEKSAVPEEEWQRVALFDVDQNEVITASDVMTLTIIARLHLPGLVIPACGNGIVETGEQCDDGNTRNGDFCSASCTLPTMKLCLKNPALYWDQETDTCIAERTACSDPDGGKVYETAAISYGFVTRAKPCPQVRTNGQDLCVSSTKLMEHFCGANDTLESETVDCPHGCRNGTCLPPPPPPVTVTGNLYVTEGGKPRSRQLLAGTQGDSVLWVDLRAQHEDIRIDSLRIAAGVALATEIERLDLFRNDETAPFATAIPCTVSPSFAPLNFCIPPAAQPWVIAKDTTVALTVRPRILSDEMGAKPRNNLRFWLDQTGITATGMQSQTALRRNNGDATAEGEIFLGTRQAGPDVIALESPPHAIVLAKFTAITNKLPARPLPIGLDQEIGRFEFTAANNSNTAYGRNAAKLSDITFTVATANVSIDADSFRWYKTGNPAIKTSCTATMPAQNGTYLVTCSDTGAMDTTIGSGESVSFSLEADIEENAVNPAVDSALQVSITNFTSPEPGSNSHIRWTDEEATYRWIEHPETTVFSTLLQGILPPPPPPPPVGPTCGNGQVEAGEQCDDGGTEDGDGCSAQCTTEEPVIHLMSVEVDGANAIVSYGKNFATCGHLRTTGGQLVHTQNVFCDNGTTVVVTQPLTQVQVTPGQTVQLCHGNNGNICSLPVIVTGSALATESEEDTPGGGLPPAAE